MAVETIKIEAIGRWGRFPTFLAKVGSHASSCVLVRRVRSFHVGQRIEFCCEHDLRGMAKGCTPTWNTGIVWKIESTMLFIGLH